MNTRHADRGKAAEKLVQDWLEARSQAQASFAYHRYPDARAARGTLPAQPADYLVSQPGKPVHLEVKECANALRLPKDKVSQYGKLKMFSLAGFRTFVLIYRSALSDWVFLNELDLFEHEECPASFPMSGLTSYPTHTKALERIFG